MYLLIRGMETGTFLCRNLIIMDVNVFHCLSICFFRLLFLFVISCITRFSVAAVTSEHNSLTQQEFILSQFWRSRSLLSTRQPCSTLSGGSRENLFLASSSFWWLSASLDLWQHHSRLSLHVHIASICLRLCVSFMWILINE